MKFVAGNWENLQILIDGNTQWSFLSTSLSEWNWNFAERAFVVSDINDAMIDVASGAVNREQSMINFYYLISSSMLIGQFGHNFLNV